MVPLQRPGRSSALFAGFCLVVGILLCGYDDRSALAQTDEGKPDAAAPATGEKPSREKLSREKPDAEKPDADDTQSDESSKRADKMSLAWKSVNTITSLPRTHSEVESLYGRHSGHACEIVPPGEPFEMVPFSMFLTERERKAIKSREIMFPSSRRHVFSVGIDVLPDDQRQLPTLSAREIMKYINNHYVSIQARVQKDPVSGTLFLNHRPLAATMPCDRIRVTQDFQPAVKVSAQAYYGIGLFLEEGQEPVPENLRTLVLIHRNRIIVPSTLIKAKSIYEWTFIRARPATVKGSESLVLHTFVTTGERSELHYIRPAPAPRRPTDASLIGSIIFTSYSGGGLYPEQSAMRRSSVKTKVSYSLSKLNELAKAQEWNGDALDNLTRVLDAIIDNKLPQDIAALSPGELADVELQQNTDDSLSATHDPNQQMSEFDKELAEIRARQTKSPTMSKEFEELAQSPVAWGSILGGIFVVIMVRRSFLKRKQRRSAERSSRSKSGRSSGRSHRHSSGRGSSQRGASRSERDAGSEREEQEPDELSDSPESEGVEGVPSRVPQVSLTASAATHDASAPLGETQRAASPRRPEPKAACIRTYRNR